MFYTCSLVRNGCTCQYKLSISNSTRQPLSKLSITDCWKHEWYTWQHFFCLPWTFRMLLLEGMVVLVVLSLRKHCGFTVLRGKFLIFFWNSWGVIMICFSARAAHASFTTKLTQGFGDASACAVALLSILRKWRIYIICTNNHSVSQCG